jgi:endonuclease/exonuclease/phosphatase family metal-dependent hydrolase
MRTFIKGLLACAALLTVPVPTFAEAPLSLLTYNVKGLPWPIASGRPAALRAIAAQLRSLRATGQQPHIVAMQEAFVDQAKAIGQEAGYRYSAFGPSEDAAPLAALPADKAFLGKGSFWLGERSGKHADSGLAVFSDFPIIAVRRIAYPVCAGYDCLANKGALAVLIAQPGMRSPVIVVDTHLNSNAASRAPRERANHAYFRQIDTLSTFVTNLARTGYPILIAGDFNVGPTTARRSYFQAHLLAPALGLGAVQRICTGIGDCALDNRRDVLFSEHRARDWLMFRSDTFQPVRLSAPFGTRSDGSMLSDHVGIAVTYAVAQAFVRPATGIRVAMR